MDEALGCVVEVGEIVAARGEEPPDLRDGIVGVEILLPRKGSAASQVRSAALRQRQLFLAIGGVEAKERFGHAGIADREVADLERGDVDVGEHRFLQDRLHPRGVIGAAVAGEIGQIDLVGAGEAKQHVGRHRPLIAFQQRDIGGGDFQVGRHVGLGQPEIAPQPAQPGAHENGTGA